MSGSQSNQAPLHLRSAAAVTQRYSPPGPMRPPMSDDEKEGYDSGKEIRIKVFNQGITEEATKNSAVPPAPPGKNSDDWQKGFRLGRWAGWRAGRDAKAAPSSATSASGQALPSGPSQPSRRPTGNVPQNRISRGPTLLAGNPSQRPPGSPIQRVTTPPIMTSPPITRRGSPRPTALTRQSTPLQTAGLPTAVRRAPSSYSVGPGATSLAPVSPPGKVSQPVLTTASTLNSPALGRQASNASLSSTASTAHGNATSQTPSSGSQRRERMTAQERMAEWAAKNPQRKNSS